MYGLWTPKMPKTITDQSQAWMKHKYECQLVWLEIKCWRTALKVLESPLEGRQSGTERIPNGATTDNQQKTKYVNHTMNFPLNVKTCTFGTTKNNIKHIQHLKWKAVSSQHTSSFDYPTYFFNKNIGLPDCFHKCAIEQQMCLCHLYKNTHKVFWKSRRGRAQARSAGGPVY